ncbi:hypothetical protein [Chachezhania antarctica]|uniref:hypothetical protein n=1 Tax=Chachezhania antarctica TaxID=2340860 RepID=UPI000EB0920A|nr:hypothetical protein [Chachezhania antarctica]|tara:strand:+ start:6296 stop:6868 length:573 start_codon:yes stop_codon:yes gene_type:complete
MDQDDRLIDYMQGRLSEEERVAFEAEMARTPALEAEVTALRAAASELGRAQVPDGARAAGWDRLSAAIDAERVPQPANTNRPLTLLKVACIIGATVAVWQFGVVPKLPGQGPGYVTVTEEAEARHALRVAFAEDVALADLTALLQRIGARITEGPGAIGLYTLSFDDEAARDAAEAALADDPRVTALSRP